MRRRRFGSFCASLTLAVGGLAFGSMPSASAAGLCWQAVYGTGDLNPNQYMSAEFGWTPGTAIVAAEFNQYLKPGVSGFWPYMTVFSMWTDTVEDVGARNDGPAFAHMAGWLVTNAAC